MTQIKKPFHVIEVPLDEARRQQWPKPKPIMSSLPPVKPLTDDMLPQSIGAYVLDVANRQQSPTDFIAVCVLVTLATAIGNCVCIKPKQHDDWQIVPNLWGALIGKPSTMKSPAIQAALSPLYHMQDKLYKNWQQLQDATHAPRLMTNDVTLEKQGELLNENPRGLLQVRDELAGLICKLEHDKFRSDRAFYLEAFNGNGRFTYDRIGRGTIHIPHVTLSILGGIQPSRIAPIIRKAITGQGDDGLIQRFQLAVWPDVTQNWAWVDLPPDLNAYEKYQTLFQSLFDALPGTPDDPLVLHFAPHAQEMFRDWMISVQSQARSGKLAGVMEAYILKLPKTIASLALIFELIDGGRDDVGIEATIQALKWANYLHSHASRLYAAGEAIGEDGAMLIVQRRKELPPFFNVRDICQKNWAKLPDREAVNAALDALVKANYCRPLKKATKPLGGRPTVQYEWSPYLDDLAI